MAISDEDFDRIVGASPRKRPPAAAPSRSPQATVFTSAPASASDKMPSSAQRVAEYAIPALGMAALLHPGIRGKARETLANRAPALERFTSNTGDASLQRFAPTARNDRGIDVSPPTGTKQELGRILPGGSAALSARGVPNMLRAQTFAKEAEAILRENGAYGARLQDVGEQSAKGVWNLGNHVQRNPHDLMDFYGSIEDRSVPVRNRAVQPLVDTLRGVYDQTRSAVEKWIEDKSKTRASPTDFKEQFFKNWEKDYFPRAVKNYMGDNTAIHNFMRARTGKYPKITDLLSSGYQLKYDDPVEVTLHYLAGMNRFLAKQKSWTALEDQGFVRYYSQKGKVPDGWTRIDDTIGDRGLGVHAYMPDTSALLWNRKYSPTMQIGDDFRSIQHGFNLIKQGAFLGAAYHGVTTAIQATASDVQRAVKLTSSGDIGKAAKTALGAPAAGVKTFMQGRKLERAWLDGSVDARNLADQFDFRTNRKLSSISASPEQKLSKLYELGGGRARPYEQAHEYRFSNEGNYFDAWKRGTLKAQAIADAKNIRNNPFSGSASAVFKHIGRAADTLSAPVMKHYVPTVKNGAFYGRMSDWLEINPNATVREAADAARHIVDSIDNRFGEMIHDNIFWSKAMKMAAQLATVSYSYELGTLREIGGGITDVAKAATGQKISSERAAYIIALPIAYGMLATIWQTLRTGSPPDSVLDLVAPRTGGIDPRTKKPERLYPLGDMKDVVHLLEDRYSLVAGKLGPGPSALYQMLTNSDWKGDPITDPREQYRSASNMIESYFRHLANAMTPIPLTTQYGPQTGFSQLERGMGMRPAGMSLTAPEKSRQLKRIRDEKAWRKRQRYDKRQESYYGERHSYGGIE